MKNYVSFKIKKNHYVLSILRNKILNNFDTRLFKHFLHKYSSRIEMLKIIAVTQ